MVLQGVGRLTSTRAFVMGRQPHSKRVLIPAIHLASPASTMTMISNQPQLCGAEYHCHVDQLRMTCTFGPVLKGSVKLCVAKAPIAITSPQRVMRQKKKRVKAGIVPLLSNARSWHLLTLRAFNSERS